MEEKKDFTYSEKHPVAIAQRSKPEIPMFGIPFVSINLVNVEAAQLALPQFCNTRITLLVNI